MQRSRHQRPLQTHEVGIDYQTSDASCRLPEDAWEAIEIRNSSKPLCHVWASKMDGTNVPHQQVAFVLRCSVKLETMLKDDRRLYNYLPELADEFIASKARCLRLASAIARQFNEAGRKLFDVTTKHHILRHRAHLARLLNHCKTLR